MDFKTQQKKIVWENSQEYKALQKARYDKASRDYWADVRDQEDKMADGSDDQPYEPDVNDFFEEENR